MAESFYRLPDLQPDIDRARSLPEPKSVVEELALLRALVSKTAETTPALCGSLISTLSKLSTVQAATEIRSSQHLDRQTVLGFAREVAAILVEEAELLNISEVERGRFIDTFLLRFGNALEAAHNGAPKRANPLQLEKTDNV